MWKRLYILLVLIYNVKTLSSNSIMDTTNCTFTFSATFTKLSSKWCKDWILHNFYRSRLFFLWMAWKEKNQMPQSSLCPSNRKFKQREEFTRDQASSRAGQDAKSSNVLSSKKKVWLYQTWFFLHACSLIIIVHKSSLIVMFRGTWSFT